MRTIDKITDHVLKKMKPKEEWPWPDWWTEFVRNGPVPQKKTLKYKTFIEKRLHIKNQVNRELANRQMAVRLICNCAKGLYLEDKNHISKTFIEDRSKKVASTFALSILTLEELSRASDLPNEDKKLLMRVISGFEFNQSALAGTFARMRSLTTTAKKEILLNFGVKL
ncbi:hypothetical protein ES703_75871 [subsurface metagenome]